MGNYVRHKWTGMWNVDTGGGPRWWTILCKPTWFVMEDSKRWALRWRDVDCKRCLAKRRKGRK